MRLVGEPWAPPRIWGGGADAVQDRALVRAVRVHDRAQLSSSDCESVVGRRPPRPRAGRARAARRAPPRLHRGAGSASCARRSPASTSARSADDVVALAAAEEGVFALETQSSAAATTRWSRPRATSRRSRSPARPAPTSTSGAAGTPTAGRTTWTSSSGCSGRTRGSSTSTRRTTRPGRRCPGTCSTAWSSSAQSAAQSCSATRCTASSSTTRRPAPRRLRPLRARRLARQRLEDVRPPGAPDRVDRLSRRDAPQRGRRDEAVHDDLLERAERAPRRTRSPSPRAARRSEPRTRPREPRARGRVRPAPSRGDRVGAADGVADRFPRLVFPTRGVLRRARRRRRRAAPPRRGLRRAGSRPLGLGRTRVPEALERLERYMGVSGSAHRCQL